MDVVRLPVIGFDSVTRPRRRRRHCCLLFCSIDPTDEARHHRLGRLVNHSRTAPNLRAEVAVDGDGKPRVLLVASKAIQPGDELLWDYGDRHRAAVDANPWLKQ